MSSKTVPSRWHSAGYRPARPLLASPLSVIVPPPAAGSQRDQACGQDGDWALRSSRGEALTDRQRMAENLDCRNDRSWRWHTSLGRQGLSQLTHPLLFRGSSGTVALMSKVLGQGVALGRTWERVVFAVVVAMATAPLGCSSSEPSGPATPTCLAGSSAPCSCTPGSVGAQTCENGTFGQCVCEADSEPGGNTVATVPSPPNPLSVTTYPDDDDGAVLAGLAADGVDMSQPLVIEFPVAVPDEASAEAVSKALVQGGYDCEVVFDQGEPDESGEIDPNDEEFGPSWAVYARVEMVPAYDEIMRIQADLDRLAGPLRGRSDGWGVMVD